ncbi:NAD(P)H-hydrate dehydratase [Salinisphaera sp. Q1T1-3]|uniref:NAD(P)H-hydrate dehydratase n=1 Tax=Salinisphaera sp. Q1T1-3 TaxID=2321229 RepID=UPI000E75F1BB|nr:NAD(P)H-hydrate dehydratase [Salinisphaera sp. Q1T1-3]RJS93786.1 NAD(P)H-hydrate dehydratase [Salinisphaera sp. Q1T1-3]
MHDTNDYLPPRLYDGAQVGALDARFAAEFGVSGRSLMERAARAAYDELVARWPMPGRLVAFCGPGNNGGDGALIAVLAQANGWDVRLVAPAGLDEAEGEAARAFEAYRGAGGRVVAFEDAAIEGADLIIDALLGTGVNRDVEGAMAQAIARINEAGTDGAGILSVDIPSGLDAGTGQRRGDAVQADTTVTFIGVKLGLLTGDGPVHCGALAFDDLGAPDALYVDQPYRARRIAHRDLRRALPARAKSAHKGNNGHGLCLGGDRGMGGAIRLCAEAGLRAGAGLVSVVCHPDHAGAMAQARPELMCLGLSDEADMADRLDAQIAAASVIAVGPGLGQNVWGDRLFEQALASSKPLVVDADALNRLAVDPVQRGHWILTPHPREAARLLGVQTADILADRVAAVRDLADRYKAVVVLKGAGSLVATPDEIWLCAEGNPGMAVGGMGDVLTGVITALVAQNLTLSDAAVFGTYTHALAGDAIAARAGERGMLPSDLVTALPSQLNPVRR